WAMYAIPAVPIAYMLYVKRVRYLRISVACEEALPERGRETLKTAIDVAIMLGIIGGTATSLGLGVPLLSAFITELTGVPDSNTIKLIVLAVWTLLFGASAYRGLKKGIKVLADINMVLAGLATVFILLAGPTLFILSISVNSVGQLFHNFWNMSLWMDPIDKSGFPESWTVFYWAWWFAFGAFIGLFFGRISRGRTIRQLVLGVICWGSLGTCSFLAIAGGYSVYLESSGTFPVTQVLADQGMFVLAAKILTTLPSGKIVLAAFIVLSIVFYATTLDSAAYVLASVCSKNLRNDQEPPKVSRIIWAVALAVLTAGLIITEGLDAVKTSTVVSAVPLLPIFLLMCVSLVRWLNKDFGSHKPSKELALDEDT
ncbi:MAG: BCCT family transporter, partial [Pseudomonadota bacterium]